MDQTIPGAGDHSAEMNPRLKDELRSGDWEGLYRTSSEWLALEPNQPVATFVKHISIIFVNPPSMIQNKKYLTEVKDKDWKAVESWFKDFYSEPDLHNPYFQLVNFIIQPSKKKVTAIEAGLQDNPDNPELLFIQSLALRNHRDSIEKLQAALLHKSDFPAALYILGIYSLELNQPQEAERYFKRTLEIAPDFLEAHYQLGSLYALYISDAADQAKIHFEKVIELDPDGGAGQDARKILETNSQPQYGQRIGTSVGGRRGGLSIFYILAFSLLAVWLFAFPISSLFKIGNPTAVGIMAGLFVFIGLYMSNARRK